MSTSSSGEHPNLLRLDEINLIACATCAYLETSTTQVPSILFARGPSERRLDAVEANEYQDSSKLHDLCTCTESQAREIQAIHTNAAWLELASNPSLSPRCRKYRNPPV